MLDLLRQLMGSRVGLTVLGLAATGLVGGGIVAHDSPEGQAMGAGAVAVVGVGLAVVGPRLVGWLRSRGTPPAGPGGPNA